MITKSLMTNMQLETITVMVTLKEGTRVMMVVDMVIITIIVTMKDDTTTITVATTMVGSIGTANDEKIEPAATVPNFWEMKNHIF
jgi:hypothetical protein